MLNMKKALLTFAALIALSAPAMAMDVSEIVNKANHTAYYQGEDGRSRVKMEITDKQGRKRTRDFVILRKDIGNNDKEQKFYVYFNRPADVNKTVFMVWKHVGQDDDRWMYLPALDLVKRIAASDERTSFVGSDYFYEDVSGRNPIEDNHELIETTDNYYIVKSTPKDPNLVEFSYYKNYIHKTSFIPVKTEFYDKRDQLYRVSTAEAVETIQGHPTVVKASIKDLKSGSQTVMTHSGSEYDIGLPNDIFTERYLRQPPMEYIKR